MPRQEMIPSIISILTSLGLAVPKVRALRDQTRNFLMLHNHNDCEKVSRLGLSALEILARDFLMIYGDQYFPATGDTSLKWPADSDALVEQIRRIMFRQKIAKYAAWKAKQNASQQTTTTTSDNDSDDDESQRPSRKRPATAGAQPWSPGGAQGDSPAARIYPTRSNAQPGMPVLPSIETDDTRTLNNEPVNKRLCLQPSSQGRTWRAVNSPSLAQPQAAASTSQSVPTRKDTLSVVIPLRPSLLGPEKQDQHQAQTVPESPELPARTTSILSEPPQWCESVQRQRPYALTGLGIVDEFILENNLHLPPTPERGRPAPPVTDQPQCEPTPPPSSAPQPDAELELPPLPSSCRNASDHPLTEERDCKQHIRLVSLAHDYPNTIDLTGPDVVEIQTSEDQFRNIHKARAPRVLQKLLDVLMDEFRICRRNARQAPMGQSRRHWEIKMTHLEEILKTIQEDDGLWQGGCTSDRTVAML